MTNLIGEELKKFKQNENYRPGRIERVELFNITKKAQDDLETNKNKLGQGLIKYHEFLETYLRFNCSKIFDDLLMIPMETQMLQIREKLNTDQEFKEQFDKDSRKPIPKPQFFQIDVRPYSASLKEILNKLEQMILKEGI